MGKTILNDEQVEVEINRLLSSDLVRLAKQEMRIKQRRRQYMYSLRTMERRGRELSEDGYTLENIRKRMLGDIQDIDEVEAYERNEL